MDELDALWDTSAEDIGNAVMYTFMFFVIAPIIVCICVCVCFCYCNNYCCFEEKTEPVVIDAGGTAPAQAPQQQMPAAMGPGMMMPMGATNTTSTSSTTSTTVQGGGLAMTQQPGQMY